jgi:uncharacterized protein YbjT (DUF2867 family)
VRAQGKTYAITGPEALTFSEVVARLTTASGRPLRYQPLSEGEFAQMIVQWGGCPLPSPWISPKNTR